MLWLPTFLMSEVRKRVLGLRVGGPPVEGETELRRGEIASAPGRQHHARTDTEDSRIESGGWLGWVRPLGGPAGTHPQLGHQPSPPSFRTSRNSPRPARTPPLPTLSLRLPHQQVCHPPIERSCILIWGGLRGGASQGGPLQVRDDR